MATPPRPNPPPPPPRPNPPPPLRDPAEGKPPAIAGGHLAKTGDPTQQPQPHGTPDPPVETVGDEQRKRAAEIEAQGVEDWKDENDDREDAEPKGATVEGVGHGRRVAAETIKDVGHTKVGGEAEHPKLPAEKKP